MVTGDWRYRHAAIMAISAIGEGCHTQMQTLLPQLVEAILPFLQDPVSQTNNSVLVIVILFILFIYSICLNLFIYHFIDFFILFIYLTFSVFTDIG